MDTKSCRRSLLTLLSATLAAGVVFAADPATQKAEEPKKPRFEFGFEERIRNENWNNILDYNNSVDDEREQIRYRTRAWVKAPLGSNVDFFAGINSETNQKLGKDNFADEWIFESAYVDIKKLLVKNLSLRVGRQNIMKGEGFLFLEGNPGDGSRTIYFNAFDLAYTYKKSKFEVIGISNPYEDRYLPQFHDANKRLNDWNEQAIGLYYTDTNHKKTNFEAYYFLKKEFHCLLPTSNYRYQGDRHINTAGGRVVQQLNSDWSVTGEFAGQWGFERPNKDIRAWGGYGYVKRTFKRAWRPYALAGYWVFSGDDPATGNRIEGWNPLFSRWPKWSELYIYSQVPERGVGYWTNLGMYQGEFGMVPSKKTALRVTYYYMDAFHPFQYNPAMFGPGTHRGSNAQIRFDVTPNKWVKGHVLWEQHLPGDFYQRRDLGYFLRFEVIFTAVASPTTDAIKRFMTGQHSTQPRGALGLSSPGL